MHNQAPKGAQELNMNRRRDKLEQEWKHGKEEGKKKRKVVASMKMLCSSSSLERSSEHMLISADRATVSMQCVEIEVKHLEKATWYRK